MSKNNKTTDDDDDKESGKKRKKLTQRSGDQSLSNSVINGLYSQATSRRKQPQVIDCIRGLVNTKITEILEKALRDRPQQNQTIASEYVVEACKQLIPGLDWTKIEVI